MMLNTRRAELAGFRGPTVLTAAVLCLSSPAGAADPSLTETQTTRLREAVETTRADERLVGVQAAVYYRSKIAWSAAVGLADLEHNVPVTAATRFEVASITKAFTGLALLQLAEQGRVDLDAPVQRYVPGFPEKPEGVLTTRLLAGGLGGIRHYSATERTPEFYSTHYDDVTEALEIFADDPLVSKPGEEVVYSSYGYNLLAAVVEGASGKRFQDHIREVILDPLSLANTGTIDVRYPMRNRSRTYSFIDAYSRELSDNLMVVPTMEHSYNAGGGNLYSTAEDLAAFGSHFIAPGFLSEQVHDQIYEPHYSLAGEPTWFSDGWVLIDLASTPRSLIAGGSYPGTLAILRVYPDDGMVIALLANTWGAKGADGRFANHLSGELARIVLSSGRRPPERN